MYVCYVGVLVLHILFEIVGACVGGFDNV